MIFNYILAHMQLLPLFGFLIFSRTRLFSYLHIFQQEEYDNLRFLQWTVRTRSFDLTASSLIVIIAILSGFTAPAAKLLMAVLLLVVFILISIREWRHQQTAKKPLVRTRRALRTVSVAWFLAFMLAAVIAFVTQSALIWLLPVQLCPVYLVVSNVILAPVERKLKAKFWDEAHGKIGKYKPTVIGITGSYGKTTVKHILGHILQFAGPTLITPGSVNTAMGISRIIREELRSTHKYFIVEMGAYGLGSIRKLCNLTPPDLGILTAIGSAHLERFGSRETTARAKMELSSAVLARGGKMIVSESVAKIPVVQEVISSNEAAFDVCGEVSGRFVFANVLETSSGLELSITHAEGSRAVIVPLFGRHQALNVTLAYAAAVQLGVAEDEIVDALRTVPQIAHRLDVQVRHGIVFIDDSYNSNPVGFESALDTLKVFRNDRGKTFLITPGMVELGREHDSEHFRLGKRAAEVADVVYVVAPKRIQSFVGGLKEGNCGAIELFDTFSSAYAKLTSEVKINDAVLIENDLPDVYERALVL